MTQSNNRLMAMTAIAAVLALATPANAQDAQPVPDPLGATSPGAEPAASTEPAPSTATPVDPLSATTAIEAAPATAPTTRARTTPRRATTPAAQSPVRRAAPARPAARTTAAVPPIAPRAAPAETTKITAPLATPIVAARPPAAALPAPVEATKAAPVERASNDVLPLAAAGGLGLLALLGAGAALRRRKRRSEEVEYAELDEPAFEEQRAPVAFTEPMREPSMTRTPIMALPIAAGAVAEASYGPAAPLPDGFDLSRFGSHVQAAYRGPSEDNPSLSLKNRLRRASAMDQMARTSDEPARQAAPRPLAAATSTRDTGAVMSKMRPALQSSGSFILGGDATPPAVRAVTQH